jgi:NTE family protein
MMIRNLVFQGGGVKGIAYVGAIDVLEQRGLMSHVNYVAGTSAGSITAALLAMGATSQDLDRILRGTAFSSFKDGGWWILGDAVRLLSQYGIYKGEAFEKWLREQISQLTERATGRAQPDVTFGQLRVLAAQKPGVFRELYTVSTNLTRQLPEVFSAESTPDVPVALAVRMSMSIPFFFEAVNFGGNFYVDGGVSWNYPIDLFDGMVERPVIGLPARPIVTAVANARDQRTLGFCLATAAAIQSERHDWTPLPVGISNLEGMVKGLFSFMLSESTRLHLDAKALERSVFIDNANIPTTDFDLTPEQIDLLVSNGRAATLAFLDGKAARVASSA